LGDAELVAKQAHINRFIHTDFGWAPVSRKIMLDLLGRVRQGVKVEIMKEHKFAIYYFSIGQPHHERNTHPRPTKPGAPG
jgi:hypothetical protein